MQEFDTWLFFAVNHGFVNPVFDWLMPFLTNFKESWEIAALALVYTIWRRQWNGTMIVLLCVVSLAIADQTASHLFKPWVQRIRPCFALADVRLMVNQSNSFSFASSHAANTAAVATMLWFFFWHGTLDEKLFSITMIVYAALVSLSRVYVGVHYPSDVLAGAAFGCAAASLVYLTYSYTYKNFLQRKT
jgi:undecaprenyl-diphosphatase